MQSELKYIKKVRNEKISQNFLKYKKYSISKETKSNDMVVKTKAVKRND